MDVHHAVSVEPTQCVARDGEPDQEPPVLPHKFDVRPQILEAYEWSLRVFCHLAFGYGIFCQNYDEKQTPLRFIGVYASDLFCSSPRLRWHMLRPR